MKTLNVILILLVTACISSCTLAKKEVVLEKTAEQDYYIKDSLKELEFAQHSHETYSEEKESILNQEIDIPALKVEKVYSEPTKGSLVYYCPDRMLENTCSNVSVCISTDEAKRAAEHLAQRVQESTGGNESEIMEDISGNSISIYPKMKVELKYDDNDFMTIYKPENPDLIFDGESDMNWGWIIKPLKVGKTQLSLIVSAYDKKNDQWVSVDIPPKIFDISVKVDPRGYLTKLWEFLENNPEWVFAQVIFPVVGFYAGRRRRRKV